jgi:predicted permease
MPALAAGVRIALDIQVDWKVLLYSLAFATITGVLFGLAPALHASRASLSSVLKDDSTVTSRFRRSRVRQTLLVAQVAFSLLLLLGAGLVLRSLEKVRPTRLGFANERILVAPIVLDETRADRRSSQQFFSELSHRVAALPGVQAVSLIDAMPGGFLGRVRRGIEIEGYPAARGEDMEIDAAIVGPGYFTHLQVPIVSGRDFTGEDLEGSACVAIVNEAFTQRYLGGRGAGLGRHLIRRSEPKEPIQRCAIVGIIRDDAWQSLNATVRPFFALSLLQSDQRRMTLLVHTAVDPAGLVPGVRQTIRQLDPTMPLSEVSPLAEHFRTASYPFRLLGVAMAGAGVLALMLALVGIYGTISYSVAQRRRELGIRIAMGALKRDILGLVVGQGMRPVGFGLGLGLLLGFAFTRLLKTLPLGMELLFGVSATDSLTFGGVTLLLGLVAIAACYVPAVRATRVSPTAILKDV